ncbi:hypothetical protein, partial [Candidatus Venteria ishoeyi]|uniref:hypothetical protein n=1 Tax=Candidatus Venteria ishoeyi TaxID=1899563 RepID=UPI00255CD795
MVKIPEYRVGSLEYPMPDVVMSGFAMFALKYPSLLQFDKNKDKRHYSLQQVVCYKIHFIPLTNQFAQDMYLLLKM